MSPRVLEKIVPSMSARLPTNDFESESIFGAYDAVRGMVKTKILQASMEPLLVSSSNSSECQYHAS